MVCKKKRLKSYSKKERKATTELTREFKRIMRKRK